MTQYPSAMHRYLRRRSGSIPLAPRGLAASAFALGILLAIGNLLGRLPQSFGPTRSTRCPLFRSR